ncbi:glycoside hydrolase family 2 protein [Microbacterium terricola]|uniref:Beta-galactosidase n=1 Tax=Microbacterium terricola TaxID=344163 RepID=A0ABM8E1T0_9MICO|nr:glycoside hydrolase family 2 TIM barrel-domain containing protein [Microbacterium terricola]UYK40374.1 glycoside hydrolase family 2 [Microbacterium terricola]BDV31908.1 beta-galactosidase [Microbacterium terricola]
MLIAMIKDDHARLPVASEQVGDHPRPQLLRSDWTDLSGTWGFAHDDEDAGLRERWFERPSFDREIRVPYPPESPASGIGDTAHHRIVWYARTITGDDLETAGFSSGARLNLHFGAVDYRCRVWVDGNLAATHEGGHTPFSIDITDLLDESDAHTVVVRAEDDPHDVSQPRGKQDWREQPHVIWYHRTSGIWQPVWLEAVPAVSIDTLHWTADVHAASVRARVVLSAVPREPLEVAVRLRYRGEDLGEARTTVSRDEFEITVSLAALTNGQAYEELLWSPEHPRLIDATVAVGDDRVSSYLGLRTSHVARGRYLLNDRPYYVRSVLNQGYWPESHLAAPSADALRAEAQLIKDLGFNATRVHQKFEDPRFLYWADRLGLLVWGEAPASFRYSPTSVDRMVREWLEIVRRDYSHPSIVTWVPLNESWGIQHVATDARMEHYARSLVDLTKALDPTRPVVSNDGWEQVDTDIVAIHDYEWDPDVVRPRYLDRSAIDELIDGVGPAGRRLVLSGDVSQAPVMLTEFGGISFHVDATEDSWGYSAARSTDDFAERLGGLLSAVNDSRVLSGFCYTQLADTLQETNGLVGSDRTPKLPIEQLARIISGRAE